MTLIDKIKSYVELWQMILPHVPAPEPVQLNMWLVMYPERIVEAGIQRASQKYREALFPDPDPQMVYRYAGGVMKNQLPMLTEKQAAMAQRMETDTSCATSRMDVAPRGQSDGADRQEPRR
jgi:hypothetical protein